MTPTWFIKIAHVVYWMMPLFVTYFSVWFYHEVPANDRGFPVFIGLAAFVWCLYNAILINH